jgi:hypothetical protein
MVLSIFSLCRQTGHNIILCMFGRTCFINLEIVEWGLVVGGGGEGTAGKVHMVGGAKDKHTLTIK